MLIDYVAARWDDDREIHSRLKRIVRRIRRGPQKGPETRLGALRLPPGAGGVGSPPRYIREIAAAAGRPIDDHRWALLDPGSYGTKKILLFLVGPDDAGPGLVVKLVRDPRFNARLERAWRGLGALEARGPELSRLGPRPAFFGHHAGLALMAEAIVTGDSLKSRLGDAAGDPLIGTVVDRLVELGIATADATRARPAEIAAELGSMVDRYASIYDSTTSERDMLWDAVRRIGATNGPVPLVLQHGDAGTWNVIIDRASEPVLIDWEAAVPHGMPLWDLFYFVRSAAVGVARRNGTRDLLAGLDRTLIRGGPLADLLAGAADRFCAATGLERDLVEPLFHLCWMHRALKTSSTVRVDRLARAHYRRFVAVGMERRDARVSSGSLPGSRRRQADRPQTSSAARTGWTFAASQRSSVARAGARRRVPWTSAAHQPRPASSIARGVGSIPAAGQYSAAAVRNSVESHGRARYAAPSDCPRRARRSTATTWTRSLPGIPARWAASQSTNPVNRPPSTSRLPVHRSP